MNNENNVNTTQNPNVTNTNEVPAVGGTVPATAVPSPAPVNGETQTSTNNLQTIVVPSSFPDEGATPAAAPATTAMPSIVNPLEVKPDEVKPEVKPVAQAAPVTEEGPKVEKVSEYQEKLRKAQENYQPPSKFKMTMTIFMLLIFILFAMFLPEISTGINKFLAGEPEGPEPDPTTGTLICTLESNTSNLDKTFTRKFSYEENKLKSAVIETSTRGDVTLDEATLDDLYNTCNTISSSLENVNGVQVICEYSEGLLVERERFDYATYDVEAINAAYTEAGSSVLEYDYEADIDEIMKSMRQAGFTCNKEKK